MHMASVFYLQTLGSKIGDKGQSTDREEIQL